MLVSVTWVIYLVSLLLSILRARSGINSPTASSKLQHDAAPALRGAPTTPDWVLFNDFCIAPTSALEVVYSPAWCNEWRFWCLGHLVTVNGTSCFKNCSQPLCTGLPMLKDCLKFLQHMHLQDGEDGTCLTNSWAKYLFSISSHFCWSQQLHRM